MPHHGQDLHLCSGKTKGKRMGGGEGVGTDCKGGATWGIRGGYWGESNPQPLQPKWSALPIKLQDHL